MSVTTKVPSEPSSRVAPFLPMLMAQTRAELLKLWRTPAFSVISLALPVVGFLLFWVPNANSTVNGVKTGKYLLASFAAYGVLSVMLFSFGVSVAVERGQKLNVLMRATPLNPLAFLLAKVLTALAFGLATVVLLFAFGTVVGGVRMDALLWVTLILRLLFGALPFIALGFAIGYLTGPNSAAPFTQMLFLILSFGSGLFVPLSQLPSFMQRIAPYLPTFSYAQIAWNALGAGDQSLQRDVLWLLGYCALFVCLALAGYRREDTKTFG
ncbi:MAG: ABC transporter permease [Dehalococcoidia bacterium]